MARTSLFNLIVGLLNFWTKKSYKFHALKDDETKRPISVSLGVQSIIQSIISLVAVALGAFLLTTCVNGMKTDALMLIIFVFIGLAASVAVMIFSFIQGFLGAMLCWIYQLRLNKKAVGFIAIVVWILCLVGAILAALFILSTL